MTNHSQTAAMSVVDVANALHSGHVKLSSDAYVAALRDLRTVDLAADRPLDPTLQAACELFLAVEQLQDAAEHAMKALREKIAATMADAGCPGIYTSGHHVTPTDAARSVVITDADALAARHPDLMTDPRPAPDKTLIGRALRDGMRVTGAELSNGGSPGVRFNSIRKKVA